MYSQLEHTMISYISTLNKLKYMLSYEQGKDMNLRSVINEAISDIEKLGGTVRLVEGNTLTLINIDENKIISRL